MHESLTLINQVEIEDPIPLPGSADESSRTPAASRRISAPCAREEVIRLVQQLFLRTDGEPQRLVIFAGISQGNGCSEIATAVAETLALDLRRRVCLVDGNLRSPSLTARFDLGLHAAGLADALLHPAEACELASPVCDSNLRVLGAGRLIPGVSELLNSSALPAVWGELRRGFDCVVVDTPPLTPYSDALLLAQGCDGLVLVIEAGVTRREAASNAMHQLHAAGITVLGAVLNKRTYPIPEGIYRRL